MADVQCAGCGAAVETGVTVCPACGSNPKTGGEPVVARADFGARALWFSLGGLVAAFLIHGWLVVWIGPALSLAGLYYGVASLTAKSGADQSRGKAWAGIVCAAVLLVPVAFALVWQLTKSVGS